MSKKAKKKILWKNYAAVAFCIMIGAICGVMIGSNESFMEDLSFFSMVWLFLGMYAAITVQTIIHEGGHLLFGLLTGYRFASFRIFQFMWIKDGGQIRLKRFSLAGTGGQCLLNPPEMKNGKIPYVLYHMGGAILNVVTSVVFLWISFRYQEAKVLSVAMLILGLMGILLAILNGVPLKVGMINNDGYNTLELSRDPEALHAFWVQMKVNELTTEGLRIKDMPEEWFVVADDEKVKNSIVAVLRVLFCNRLMDAHLFEKADAEIKQLLDRKSGIVGLHRSLLVLDRIYLELIGENRREILDKMLTKEIQQLMKRMKNYPSVIRIQYAYALLGEHNPEKAEKLKKLFENIAKTYPYPSELQSERELMGIAEEKFLKNSME